MNNQNNTDLKKKRIRISDIFFTTIFTLAFLIQIVLMFMFFNELGFTVLLYLGYIIWGFSLYFSLIPFWIFKKHGEVEKGRSYLHTTKLVENGPYAIIRHPQYLGGVLFTISISLWTQILLTLILSIIIIILSYQWTYVEDKKLIEKFGDDYRIYITEVPRLNPLLGIIRYFIRKEKD